MTKRHAINSDNLSVSGSLKHEKNCSPLNHLTNVEEMKFIAQESSLLYYHLYQVINHLTLSQIPCNLLKELSTYANQLIQYTVTTDLKKLSAHRCNL